MAGLSHFFSLSLESIAFVDGLVSRTFAVIRQPLYFHSHFTHTHNNNNNTSHTHDSRHCRRFPIYHCYYITIIYR